jgi:hypothetical protein
MKTFLSQIFLSTLILTNSVISFSQNITDLGRKSYSDIKSMQKTEACEITIGKALTYCVEDGSNITYIFKNNILNGIMFSTPFSSKSEAEIELKKEISAFSTKNRVSPYYMGGQALFRKEDLPYKVSYGLQDRSGTTYLVYYTFLE